MGKSARQNSPRRAASSQLSRRNSASATLTMIPRRIRNCGRIRFPRHLAGDSPHAYNRAGNPTWQGVSVMNWQRGLLGALALAATFALGFGLGRQHELPELNRLEAADEPAKEPAIKGWKKGTGWGWIWGKDDEVGSLNAMTPETIRA